MGLNPRLFRERLHLGAELGAVAGGAAVAAEGHGGLRREGALDLGRGRSRAELGQRDEDGAEDA